jgi:hypothetical protein
MKKNKILDLLTELDDCVQIKELIHKNRAVAGLEFGLLVDDDEYALQYQKYEKRYHECFTAIVEAIKH